MTKKGVDISHWQKSVDFVELKNTDNIDFVILKCGGSDKGRYIDTTFYSRYMSCKQYNISVGAYFIVGKKCDSIADGYADALFFLEKIKGLQFDYPIYIDFELPPVTNRIGNTNAVIAFCETCEQAGYYIGIYASDISGFRDRLDITRLTSYDKWVASYSHEPTYVKKYGVWQYSSKGCLNAIKGNVDLDVSYKDYPTIIKSRHLNGY